MFSEKISYMGLFILSTVLFLSVSTGAQNFNTGSLISITSAGEYLSGIAGESGDLILFDDKGFSTVLFSPDHTENGFIFRPSYFDGMLAFLYVTSSADYICKAILPETQCCSDNHILQRIEICGPFEDAGLPAWDDEGNLWFTAENYLWKNDFSTDIELSIAHISISPSIDGVVYCDRINRIFLTDISTADGGLLADHRSFYAPFFISTENVVSPSLEGEIWLTGPDGNSRMLACGSQPIWWPEKEYVLFIKTEDNGEILTASDVYAVDLQGNEIRITFTDYILEISPVLWNGKIAVIDAFTGSPLLIEN